MAAFRSHLVRLGLFLFNLSCFFVLGSCASLPDAGPLLRSFHRDNSVPTVIDSRGRLSEQEASRLIAGLEGEGGPTEVLKGHLGLTEAIGGSPIMCGNDVTLLINGDVTFAAMLDAIRGAKETINLETYIFQNDEVGRLFANLLMKKRAQGVEVNLIYDGFGCRKTPRSFFDRLREAGVRTVEFNPMRGLRLLDGRSLFHRTHRKLLIVDGAVAFTGGINIGKDYLRTRRPGDLVSPAEEFWRDTDVMIEGPAVAEFQKLFLATWASQSGETIPGGNYFPKLEDKGDEPVQAVGSTTGTTHRATYLMYISAIAHASRSIHITQSYFVPDGEMLEVLEDAARRGVDVRIILPEISDHEIIRQAGRWRYAELLRSGVKLYECRGAILHAKTAVIDSVWSTVGSTNLEIWSLAKSDEANAVILGPRFGAEMEASFARDLAQSRQILPAEWSRRPLLDRVKELFAGLLGHWL